MQNFSEQISISLQHVLVFFTLPISLVSDFVEVLQRHPSADVGFALMSESRSPCQPALTAAEVGYLKSGRGGDM